MLGRAAKAKLAPTSPDQGGTNKNSSQNRRRFGNSGDHWHNSIVPVWPVLCDGRVTNLRHAKSKWDETKTGGIFIPPVIDKVMLRESAILVGNFVVDGDSLDPFVFPPAVPGRNGAGFAIGRDDYATMRRDFSVFLLPKIQGVIVDLAIAAHVRIRIAGHGIIFAIKFADPFIVRRFAVRIGAIDRDFGMEWESPSIHDPGVFGHSVAAR